MGSFRCLWGALGDLVDTFFAPWHHPSRKKLRTSCENAFFAHAVGKRSHHDVQNVTETICIPCFLKEATFENFQEKVSLGAPKSEFWGAFWYYVPHLFRLCAAMCGNFAEICSITAFPKNLVRFYMPGAPPAFSRRHRPRPCREQVKQHLDLPGRGFT